MSECRECGHLLVEVVPRSWSSPAEWECPVCEGGVDPERTYPVDRWDIEYETARTRGWDD
jgi:hypothetical protein